MSESDYSIDDLREAIESVAAGTELLAERFEKVEKKLDSLFHDVPPYEAEVKKVDQRLVPRSGNIRRRLEIAEHLKSKQIPEAS